MSIHGAALEGSTSFLRRSSMIRARFVSSLLAELKYAFFRSTRRKTKKLQRSNLFPSMIFNYGLLEGLTFLFWNSYTRHTRLEGSQLGELKYAISARYELRSKKNSFKEKLPRSYKKDRWYGQMSSKEMGDQAYSKNDWLIFRKGGTKAFMKSMALCSDMANSKDPPEAIWVLALSQIVRQVGKWNRKGSKFQDQ